MGLGPYQSSVRSYCVVDTLRACYRLGGLHPHCLDQMICIIAVWREREITYRTG